MHRALLKRLRRLVHVRDDELDASHLCLKGVAQEVRGDFPVRSHCFRSGVRTSSREQVAAIGLLERDRRVLQIALCLLEARGRLRDRDLHQEDLVFGLLKLREERGANRS